MRFTALDGWRGMAAIVVAMTHLSAAGWFYGLPPVRHGGVAVPLFFVLSGFVIHHAYADRLKDVPAGWRFVLRRFGRLYPLHLFTLGLLVGFELIKLLLTGAGIGAGQAAFTGSNDLSTLLAHLMLMQGVTPVGGGYSWNIPSWSISVEGIAYGVFAVVTVVAGARAKAATVVAALVCGGAMIGTDLVFPGLHNLEGRGLLLAIFGFFAGGAVHQAYEALQERGWKGGTVAELFACLILGGLFWGDWPGDFIYIAGFAVVILVFAFEGGVVSNGLKRTVFQFVGRISYSIYLVHFVLLSLMAGTFRMLQSATGTTLIRDAMIDFGPPGAMDVLAVVYLAVVILCSWATYHWVEAPGRAFFNALSDRKPVYQAWRAALDDIRPAPAR